MGNDIATLDQPAQIRLIIHMLQRNNPGARVKVAVEYNGDDSIEYSAWLNFPGAQQFPGSPVWLLAGQHRSLARLREFIERD